ncbi:MAG: hypothetical protein ABJN42_15980, partial [Roseibium sp.]|uniref:hypothetical protein n=1 Tax=Roseibium sp. TaxID=1936156 RepID=UPI003296E1EC
MRYFEDLNYVRRKLSTTQRVERGEAMMVMVKQEILRYAPKKDFCAEYLSHAVPMDFALQYPSYSSFIQAISACLRHLRAQGFVKKSSNGYYRIKKASEKLDPVDFKGEG